MSWINKDNLLDIIKNIISEIKTFKDFIIFIICTSLVLGLIGLGIWLPIAFCYYFLLPLPVLIIEGVFNISSRSSAEAAIGGVMIWIIISWIFTGRPPLVSILFRIICLLGVGIGITLLVNKHIIIDALQYADTFLHEYILAVSNPQTEDNRVLSLHILESLRYFDTLIHNLIDILPKNPLQLIGVSISLGFLSEFSAGIRNKNIITINNASAENDK